MVVCAHQLADIGLGERGAVDVGRPLLPPGRRVSPRGAAGGGVRKGLEGEWALLGAQVGGGQGGVQRKEVSRRGQNLGPLGVRERGSVRLICAEERKRKKDER